ncbi:MAG TPA: beta-galactosidase domain 4-containing protein, partial [Chthoniobacterales bacterium]|nr:beta-galactosidase domain 4-containing protein [Chthoniobacterales bacterium]
WGKQAWKPGAEYFLTVKFRLREKTPWADAGFVVAETQLPVAALPSEEKAASTAPVKVSQNGADWTASAGGSTITVDGKTGWLKSFTMHGRESLAAPLRPNFWRVPTDNDLGWQQPKLRIAEWKDAVGKATLTSLTGETTDEGGRITASLALPFKSASTTLTYTLRSDGSLKVEMTLDLGGDKGTPELPRVGVEFALPGSWSHVEWFGRGPQENYRDRKTGAFVGRYTSTVNDWITPYVRPQENGNRTDLRWLKLTNASGTGLLVQSDGAPFGATAWPYTQEDLETATHDHLLPHRDTITVNVDGFQIGVGGDTSWGLPVHDQYRLKDKGKYEFAVILRDAEASK